MKALDAAHARDRVIVARHPLAGDKRPSILLLISRHPSAIVDCVGCGLFKEHTGSYVMTFAGYNAGRGRVRQWVAQYGDPRDPKIDAVDW